IVLIQNYVTKQSLQTFSKMSNLKEIQIEFNEIRIEDILNSIDKLSHLKITILNGNGRVDEELNQFIESCKDKLTNKLTIPKSISLSTQDLALILSNYKNLKRLYFRCKFLKSSN